MPASVLQPPSQYLEMAQAVIRHAPDIHDFLNRCEACGLPVEDRRQTLNEQCEFCTKFIQNFYPDAT